MTPEAQRIAIAEACGFRAEEWESGGWMLYRGDIKVHHALDGTGSRESAFAVHAPNYLGDLNAMHEAEQILWETDWNNRYFFNDHLANILKGRVVNRNEWDAETLLDATAAQRAEAFLRTIGKWDDKA